jgi:WD40 repeat protein
VLEVSARLSTEIPNSESWTLDLDFSSDGRNLAGVGQDGSIATWDLDTMTRSMVIGEVPEASEGDLQQLSDDGLVQVEFLPGSDEVVTAGLDGSVRVWNPDEGSNRVLHDFDFPLSSLDVSGDRASVAAADSAGNVMLFDVETGEEVVPRPQSVPGQTSVVFSPDGRYLAGGGPGPVVYLWDLQTGEIHRRIGQAMGKPTVAFVTDGDEIRAASLEGIVRGYVLDELELLEIAREEPDRDMTEEECQRYLRRPCD